MHTNVSVSRISDVNNAAFDLAPLTWHYRPANGCSNFAFNFLFFFVIILLPFCFVMDTNAFFKVESVSRKTPRRETFCVCNVIYSSDACDVTSILRKSRRFYLIMETIRFSFIINSSRNSPLFPLLLLFHDTNDAKNACKLYRRWDKH